ncbi:alpha/beta hydrolase [Shimia sagamensis]|uniref:Alpha/beta hydrolase fold n=1 Tax=Shimia sagamensis TaxID=1566352 RepID=A0ABY1N7U9_9RHOB|nr:alpha/beta hydrolase [Shimia sagamensis]SMP02774.1 alpha/beta hydrolase fold [Shimia sagamensis]
MDWDDAYSNGAYIEGAEAYPPRWASEAAAYRASSNAEEDIAYGDGERHKFDLIQPNGDAKGLLVFVHGGYWMAFDKSYWSHFARAAISRGWAVVLPSYDLAPSARISEITEQVAAAVTKAAEHVEGPIMLAGHSAGGHLVARMACDGVLPEDVAARISRVVPISPVADLRPLMNTSMNNDLKLDETECAAESPVLQTPRAGVDVTVLVGAKERPVFLDQARWLSEAWSCDMVVAGGKHHFDVIDAFSDPDSDMAQMLFP